MACELDLEERARLVRGGGVGQGTQRMSHSLLLIIPMFLFHSILSSAVFFQPLYDLFESDSFIWFHIPDSIFVSKILALGLLHFLCGYIHPDGQYCKFSLSLMELITSNAYPSPFPKIPFLTACLISPLWLHDFIPLSLCIQETHTFLVKIGKFCHPLGIGWKFTTSFLKKAIGINRLPRIWGYLIQRCIRDLIIK